MGQPWTSLPSRKGVLFPLRFLQSNLFRIYLKGEMQVQFRDVIRWYNTEVREATG